MTTIRRLCCQGCGADLDIPEGVRFFNCNYCHAKLEVVEDESVTHTRLLEKVAQQTEALSGNLRVIELQNDLERLDREWAVRRESHMIHGRNGRISTPGKMESVAGGLIPVVVGIIWIVVVASTPAPGIASLAGFVIIGIGIYAIMKGTDQAQAYQDEMAGYETQRNQLIQEIERSRDRR